MSSHDHDVADAVSPDPLAHGPRRLWLHKLALVLGVATFALITIGGHVTSHAAGMSVPDWPSSFGRWLLLPVHIWADLAVFLEHTHRLVGAISGVIAIGMFVAAGVKLGWRHRITCFALIILIAYIIQGLMGGFRVTEASRTLAIIHGVTGQIVLAMVVVLAAMLSGWWMRQETEPVGAKRLSAAARWLTVVLVGLFLLQLIFGAIVRHTGSAPAIPDAPFVYGGFVPPMDAEAIEERFAVHGGGDWRVFAEEPALPMEAIDSATTPDLLKKVPKVPAPTPSAAQVLTHYTHRVLGMVVLPIALVLVVVVLAREHPSLSGLRAPMLWLVGLFLVQILLGLSVIWSRENPEIATAHQAVGAALLAVVVWLAVRTMRLRTEPALNARPAAHSPEPASAT